MRTYRNALQYSVGLAASTTIIVVINYFHFSRRVTCVDCFFPFGLPFTLYRDGGYGGGGGIVWLGVAGDVLTMVALGFAFGWVWQRISRLRSPGV
jgi:hypothetical protein